MEPNLRHADVATFQRDFFVLLSLSLLLAKMFDGFGISTLFRESTQASGITANHLKIFTVCSQNFQFYSMSRQLFFTILLSLKIGRSN